jgi:hypothetical protein
MNYIKMDIAASRNFWTVTLAVTTLLLLISGLFIVLDVIR